MRKIAFNRILLFIVSSCVVVWAHAQTTTINGRVFDSANNSGLALTSVKNASGKTLGISSENGNFTVKATIGEMLTFSYQGYRTQKLPASSDFMTVVLSQNEYDKENQDVVVVAMDMKRNTRELGYSTQSVAGTDIKNTQRDNFINALQGRVAGLTINTTSGLAGASSQIILRGFNSASLNNQPIFVIDGVIMDNSTINESILADNPANRNNDYTNRSSDINPNDIASITVLKGPEATALYGSQAGSGAIVITTKKPEGGHIKINYDNSFRTTTVTRLPDINNSYAPGINGTPSNALANDFTYFGPAYPSDTTIYDNVGDFFKTGFANTQNLAVDFGSKVSSFRLTGTYLNNSGYIPNNSYRRYNLKLSNVTHIGKFIDITPSISYINSTNTRPRKGSSGFMLDLLAWAPTDDAKNYQDAQGNKRLLYATAPNSELIDNPFFSAYRNYSTDKTARWMASLGIDIRPFDWLTVSGRFGYDTYHTNGFYITDPQSSVLSVATGGYLSDYFPTVKNYNHTITATADKKFGKFSTRLMLGTMWQNNEEDIWSIAGSALKDKYNMLSHSTDSSNIGGGILRAQANWNGLPNLKLSRQIAYFGEASIGYDNKVYLTYTHRFESASVFPQQYRNYNYPAISLSAILSDIIPGIKGDILNYWKLRAATAKTAKLMDPYANQSTFVLNYASSVNQAYSYDYYNNNPLLKPEFQRTFEVGTELKMFKDIVSLDATYYNTHNTDQISEAFRASYATGFVLNTQNANESRNQGVELTLDINPIKNKNFNWDIEFNFNKMWSNVIAIPKSISPGADYYLSDTWAYANTRAGIIQGDPMTIITGYSYQRNNQGQILINPTTGLPVVNTSFRKIGDRNPDFRLGTLNNFSYKNWTLSFLWDLKVGGDIFNGTEMYLTEIGKSTLTADREKPRVIAGVLQDGNENSAHPTANNIEVTPYNNSTYFSSETNGMPDEAFVQKNVNWFRLKNITLSYRFSEKMLKNIKFVRSLSVFATGSELVLFSNYHGADPDVNINDAGVNGVGGFGMDYGNVAAPVSFNFGFNVGF